MSVNTSSTSGSIGYSSEGNQIRRAVSPPPSSLAKNSPSPFASVLAEQKGSYSGFTTGPKASVSTESAASVRSAVSAGIGASMDERFAKQLIIPPKTQASAREVATRAHTIAKADMDKQRMQALEQLSQNMKSSHSLLDVASNDVTMRNLRSAIGSFNLKAPVLPMADSIKSSALQGAQRNMIMQSKSMAEKKAEASEGITLATKPASIALNSVDSPELGKLSSQFESGKDGIAAVGYDRVGGTSYGKYQIASRVGSMDKFLNFLDTAAPDMSEKLRDAGPANTGSRKGGMPNMWRKLAEEQPDRFEALQEKFIYESHYKPALAAISEQTSLDGEKISSVMQEVLWSTAVQHGPKGAARIFTRATAKAGDHEDQNYDQRVINNIYAIRAEQFGSSTEAVQNAVRNRMHREKNLALNMLRSDKIETA